MSLVTETTMRSVLLVEMEDVAMGDQCKLEMNSRKKRKA